MYGDFHFDDQRPCVTKAFDPTGNVIQCSFFSETPAPGDRGEALASMGRLARGLSWD